MVRDRPEPTGEHTAVFSIVPDDDIMRPVRPTPRTEVHAVAVTVDPLRRLFQEQYGTMVRLAAMLGGSAGADDAVQEAFVAVDRKLASLPPEAHAPYLRRAVINATRSSARKQRAFKRQVIPLREYQADTDEGALGDEQHRRVMAALDTLPGRQRQCLVLRYYAGLTDTEIATHLDLAPGSVKTHLRRGLDALHDRLGDLR